MDYRSPSKTNEMWENLKTQQEHRDKAKEEQVQLYAAWPLSAIILGFSVQVEFHLPVIVEVRMNRSLMNGCYKTHKKAQKEGQQDSLQSNPEPRTPRKRQTHKELFESREITLKLAGGFIPAWDKGPGKERWTIDEQDEKQEEGNNGTNGATAIFTQSYRLLE